MPRWKTSLEGELIGESVVRRTGKYKATTICPECGDTVSITFNKNKWVESFKGECDCGYRFLMKQEEIDMLQPNHPLFDIRYAFNSDYDKNKKLHEYNELKRKGELEKKYWEERYDPTQRHSRFRADERRALEKEVLN